MSHHNTISTFLLSIQKRQNYVSNAIFLTNSLFFIILSQVINFQLTIVIINYKFKVYVLNTN